MGAFIALAGLAFLPVQGAGSLIWQSGDGRAYFQLGGELSVAALYSDPYASGLIFPEDDIVWHPRLTLEGDAFWGDRIYGYFKLQADRGFDPGYHPPGQIRWDEYFLRVEPLRGGPRFQGGVFGTVFGNWVGRHDPWENPFINDPLPYEFVTALLDLRIPRGVDDFLQVRDRPDDKHTWIPVIWGPVYSPGVAIMGSLGRGDWTYAVEVKDDALSSRQAVWLRHRFDGAAWAGRLAYSPEAAWTIGISAADSPYLHFDLEPQLPTGDLHDYSQRTYGLDWAWSRGRVETWGEFIWAEFDVPNVGNLATFVYYLEAKWKWRSRGFFALRWNQEFFERLVDSSGRKVSWDHNVWRIESAFGWRLTPQSQFKVQYSFSDQDGEFEQATHFAGFEAVWKF